MLVSPISSQATDVVERPLRRCRPEAFALTSPNITSPPLPIVITIDLAIRPQMLVSTRSRISRQAWGDFFMYSGRSDRRATAAERGGGPPSDAERIVRQCDGDVAGNTARVIDDVLGAALGAAIGSRIRRWYFARKLVKAHAGVPVRVRVRAHPEGAPYWRYWRGCARRRGSVVTFAPLVRWWRRCDLTGASIAGTALKGSAADGDRVLFELVGAPAVDHLAVSPDAAPVLMAILS